MNEVKFEQNAHKYSLKRTGVDWKGWWNFDAKKYNNQNFFAVVYKNDEWNKVGLAFKFLF